MTQQLRPYQRQSLTDLRAAIKSGSRSIVLQAPTAYGKTTLAAEIMKGAVAKGNRAYFIADSIELIDQTFDRFSAEGLDCGVIRASDYRTDYSKPVQIATVQTLRNRWNDIAASLRPKIVVVDETHVLHKSHQDVIRDSLEAGAVVLGLSATPWRKGLGQHYETLVLGESIPDLVRDGYLAPLTIYAPRVPDLSSVPTKGSGGDYKEDALAEVMGDNELIGDIVTHWQKLAHDRQTIVFGINVAHSRSLCDAFQRVGVRAEHIDGYERDPERRAKVIRDYKAGDIQVLCNVGIATKGFDAPETSCLVIARPTKSMMLHFQILGRGMRVAKDHDDCLVLDHAGNCIRNGVPDDPMPTTLDDGKSKTESPDRKKEDKEAPLLKPCKACGHLSALHKCPKCGFAPEARNDVEVKDGVLYPLTPKTPEKKWTTDGLRDLYAEFLGYANLKGFKPGWAFHQCRDFAGRAPRDTRQIKAQHPSDKTMGIIKHINIKKAKSRAKQVAS